MRQANRALDSQLVELQAKNIALFESNRLKSEFLANVSHELRTPLSTVRGYVEMLNSDRLGQLDENQKTALTVMMRNLERLGTLIDEMIEFSRLEIRGVTLEQSLLSVGNLVEECVESAGPEAAAKGNVRYSLAPVG